ncbi:MAG: hypothetical protein C4523_20245 [Myxococcales bacterium]|nr:MAG: hypothetical protein C4523_20245 [Myxococcales bacterium]
MVNLDSIQHRFDTYRSLMPHRINEILLVATLYDAYILEEDGSFEELIWQQYTNRGLSAMPRIRKVLDLDAAIQAIQTHPIDLVLTIVHENSDFAFELAGRVKVLKPELPVVMLATDPVSLSSLPSRYPSHGLDRVFLWQNDPALLLAIIKYYEDMANVDNDTQVGGVRVVLLVEDNIAYWSKFLPVIYTAVMQLTRRLLDEGLNYLHKQLRMRSRAKILMADSLEGALDIYNQYRPYLLGAITDVRFYTNGRLDDEAGFRLVNHLREDLPDLPICIQSADPEKNRSRARALDTHFIDKNSASLLEDLQRFLTERLGFGDFVFRLPDGREIARAGSPRELLARLAEAPAESILHHAMNQEFSHWMAARTELKIADQLYPKRVEDFRDPEEIRAYIMRVIRSVLHEKQSDVVTRFTPDKDPNEIEFMRFGEGSLGGKARGISFLRYLISRMGTSAAYPEVSIEIPPTLVVCSGEFDRFLGQNGLRDFTVAEAGSFREIQEHFLQAPLPPDLSDALRAYLVKVREPLAVRSSSLLEDSQHLPLAGLYSTFMIPNNEPTLDLRLASLARAIRMVWASVFGDDPRSYFKPTAYRVEDEHMAVVVQKLGGGRQGEYFYPTFSGVAQSHNFYPVSYMKAEDGVAQIALGLGKTVVEGGAIVRFCPKYPQLMPQFSSIRDWLYFTQKHFYALALKPHDAAAPPGENLERLPLSVAEQHGVLQQAASVYQSESDLLVDSFFYDGPRIVTFAKVLRDPRLKLGALLGDILASCEAAMRTPVEIEFAVDLPPDRPPVFYLLQLRPMASKRRWEQVQITDEQRSGAICRTRLAHGNGVFRGVRDVVYVKPDAFDKSRTREIAEQIGQVNRKLAEEKRPYLLIGFGRWGSTDPWMGIGVRWAQISGVKILVEVGLEGFNVDPAQGTHFFQNVTSLNIGCLSVPHGEGSFLDWNWLERREARTETEYLRHLELDQPLTIWIDGRSGEAVIAAQTPESKPPVKSE